MKNENNKDLAQVLSEKISTPIYDCLVELYNCDAERRNDGEMAQSDPIKTRQEIVIDNITDVLDKINDYNNFNVLDPETLDYDYIEETVRNEYTENNIEIYNYWLWKHAPILSDYIEDAIDEYDLNIKDGGLIKIFQIGEGYFYEAFFIEVKNALETYYKEQEEEANA